jgi:putative transposase
VDRAEAWPWSSLRGWAAGSPAAFLDPGPLSRGESWVAWVNEPLTAPELARVRRSVARGTPFGSEAWVQQTAERLGLEATLRPRGRPRKRATAP